MSELTPCNLLAILDGVSRGKDTWYVHTAQPNRNSTAAESGKRSRQDDGIDNVPRTKLEVQKTKE